MSPVAVHRQGVDVPAVVQRRCFALGGATDSVHRLMVDLSVAPSHGAFSKGYMRCRGGRSSSHR